MLANKSAIFGAVAAVVASGALAVHYLSQPAGARPEPEPTAKLNYHPRFVGGDTGGNLAFLGALEKWAPTASLEEVARCWNAGHSRLLAGIDAQLLNPLADGKRLNVLMFRAASHNFIGRSDLAYADLEEARRLASSTPEVAETLLYSVIYFQGIVALRRGETENCVMCRGESSCILPLSPAARHTKPAGSRLAIEHFTEYLKEFPDDLQVRWLLNIAHMTLGEHPDKVDPQYLIRIDGWVNSEFDIGKFRDIGELVGINRFNESGAALLEDLDNDGLLDILFTSWNASVPVVLYKNMGNGKFEDVTEKAKLKGQLGGLGVSHADFDNDGYLDIYLPRGAWLDNPIRPSLLRNNGDGTFADVTEKAGLLDPVNSDTSAWADFDNDGHIDLFVACEKQPCRLYRNKGDGTFEDVAAGAGLDKLISKWKGCNWIDYDNDDYPDLFLTSFTGPAKLFHNNRNGTFTDVTAAMGIDGPKIALSCWVWDFDNDGFLDIFAPTYAGTLDDVVKGMLGQPHGMEHSNKLYRNLGGKGFKDVTKEVGLDKCFLTMGTNFGDFDNDGFLDFYLGTGDHELETLVPNRMFKNVAGKRFADITGSSGTGHLQKGHGVGCGDWDRNGTVDIVIQMGGAYPGDAYHDILFQNPGQGNNWLSVKLVGKKSNRAAIGARIKCVTSDVNPLTVHRHVSSGCSFGGNPLEQHIGLGKAEKAATLEIFWPTSGTKQVFHDVPANVAVEITEFNPQYRKLDRKPIPLPK